MQEFNVRLEDPNSEQWREVHVAAEDEKLAAALAMRQELKLVNFSLLPKEPVEPERPDSDDAEVLMQYLNARDTYGELVEAHRGLEKDAQEMLAKLEKRHGVDPKTGKAFGPTRRGRAHLAAHRLQEPYSVVHVEQAQTDVERLVYAAVLMQQDPKQWKKVLKELQKKGIPLAVVTASLFGLQTQKQIDGSAPIVWSSATMKYAMTTNAWTPDQDTHDFFNDVTNEISGTGYTAGGPTLASKTSTYDTASDQVRLDAADISLASSTITARRGVLYQDTAGAASTDPIWGWVDYGADFSTTNGTFAVTWDATGIINFDVT